SNWSWNWDTTIFTSNEFFTLTVSGTNTFNYYTNVSTTFLVDLSAASNLDNVDVIPHPVRITEDPEVFFINIPADFKSINIYTINGRLIKKIKNKPLQYSDSMVKGISWDLKDSEGVEMPGGIYLYKVFGKNSSSKVKKLIIIR
ncbi:MAG TPA: hypothetical protein VKS21_07435, partial [Spirochaetota bacterium]|nr:hypothetical protein [Spirochaetota bacterium]